MASELDGVGVFTERMVVIGDDELEIISTLDEALKSADIVLFTGGLGPTHDDITKHCLARYFDDKLIHNEEVLSDVEALVKRHGKEVNDLNKTQALVPSKCEVIRNNIGTAPGMIFHRDKQMIISMPGVPYEMKNMMHNAVIPKISAFTEGIIRIHRHLKTFGIAEAMLAEQLSDTIEGMHKDVKLAFLPSPGHVKLRLTMKGKDRKEMDVILDAEVERFQRVIGEHLYGFEGDQMESVVGALLKKRGGTLVTAESCTGGRIGSKLTSIPGSSDYFLGSAIVYSNAMKSTLLNVPLSLIEKHGAVSEEVVRDMAQNARAIMKADYALATSGIAGPDGGTEEKPVGTIWIALASEAGVKTKLLKLGFNRRNNMDLTCDYALNLLRKELL